MCHLPMTPIIDCSINVSMEKLGKLIHKRFMLAHHLMVVATEVNYNLCVFHVNYSMFALRWHFIRNSGNIFVEC